MNFLCFWFATFRRIKIWKKLEIKKKSFLSPTTTKRTSGESHLIGTKAEETLTVTKKKNRQ
jgi:hypothetical protein